MPSSISSSNHRLPKIGYRAQWLTGAIVFATLTLGLSWYYRTGPTQAQAGDSVYRWAIEMDRLMAHPAPKTTIAMLGASRAQLGFDAEVFAGEFPDRPTFLLAMFGKNPKATLHYLAEENYSGTVIVSFEPAWINPSPGRARRESQQPLVDIYTSMFGNLGKHEKIANELIRAKLQQHVHAWNYSCWKSLAHVLKRDHPDAFWVDQPSRQRKAFYDRFFTPAQLEQQYGRRLAIRWVTPQQTPLWKTQAAKEAWGKQVATIKRDIDAIKASGGQVIFVRLPIHQTNRPLWDEMVRELDVDSIHFLDIPAAREIRCPDGSHLNHDGAATFTRLLANELKHHLRK
ncbi:MAG: hypothetical protein HN370_07245 [Phycisphaerales bacterium]|nr:hypothetical protein [Phycisphaerales bacterium]